MAYVVGPNAEFIYLKQSHLFGRLGNAVDTCLGDAAVSRLHFLLEYHAPDWFLVDYSRNGTWLNDHRIAKGEQVKVKQGDNIAIGERHAICFTLRDAGAPVDILCRRGSKDSPIIETLKLQADNHLPNQQNCQIRIVRQADDWVVQHKHSKTVLHDGDWITIDEAHWQAVLTQVPNCTIELQDNPPTLQELVFHLHTSMDEESTSARIVSHQGEVRLPVRSHHYLLLLLARQRAADTQQQLDATECGWMYMETLMGMLGMPETLINIQIHRARKQLESALERVFCGKELIERRAGQVRLGFVNFAIHKGEQLEAHAHFSSPSD